MLISKRFIFSFLKSIPCWMGIVIAVLLTLLASRMVEKQALAEFEHQATNAELAIKARVKSYVDVLHSLNALFYTSETITRAQFKAYVDNLQLAKSFPGIRNLNFAPRILAHEKNAFVASVRNDKSIHPDGYPDFTIKPAGDRAEYYVLTYQEPMTSNLGTFGFDMASVPSAKSTIDQSRDTGQLSASGRLIHISGPHKHTGMAIRMPLYRLGMPLDSVEQRRAAYYGSVGAGFDIHQLMLGALDGKTLSYMRLRLYDTGRIDEAREIGTVNPDRLLLDSAGGNPELLVDSNTEKKNFFVKRVPMEVGLRVWEAEFSADKRVIINDFNRALPWMILVAGLLATILLYSIYYSLMSARSRAVEIARDMTKDLRASETSLAEAQHMAHLGSWLLEPASGRIRCSAETCRIFGANLHADTRYDDFMHRIHEEDQALVRDGIAESINTGKEFRAEHRIRQHDGTVRWVQSITRPAYNNHEMLVRGTIMDITDRRHALQALERSQELLRELTAYQDRVKEEERKRIAREIHDELGQTLLALRIDVAMLDARTAKSHPRLNQKVRMVLAHIDGTVKTIRTIINNLRPAVLDLGLTAAIEWQVAEFQRRTGIACELVISGKEMAVDDVRATTLFRVLQESLTNVIRHAHASKVIIKLQCQDQRLVMTIKDNGIGLFPEARRKANSFGLVGVEERIHALDGECSIHSIPGEGTTLQIVIPLQFVAKEMSL